MDVITIIIIIVWIINQFLSLNFWDSYSFNGVKRRFKLG